ncbi:tetratricopeptide repeat protein, partial [Alteromonas australica]
SDSDEPNLVSFYIKQEKREKASIPLSPKSLNNAAVLHYQQGDLAKSFNTFLQAYQVMPKNPAIALNLLQAITMRATQGQPRINKVVSLVKRCRTTIESSELTEEQTQRYNNMKTVLNQVA